MLLIIKRNGKEKLRLTDAKIHANGSIWHRGIPMIDGQARPEKATEIKAAMHAREWDKIPAESFAHLGKNPSGLEVLDGDKLKDERRAAAEAAITPAQRERGEIEELFYSAEARMNAADDDNTMDYYRLLGQAESRLKVWKTKYPVAARREEATKLKEYAAEKRSRADGALLYDADGALDKAAQQQRHDKFIAEAEAAEAEAKKMQVTK